MLQSHKNQPVIFCSKCLFLCLHFEIILFHLFNSLSFENKIWNFSLRHNMNLFVITEHALVFSLMCHLNDISCLYFCLSHTQSGFKLSLTSETNLKIVSFLDVTLNLNTGTHKLYNKPNNNPLYININSNHPPKIIKNLPENIQKRISKLSSSTRIFNNFKNLYNNALSASEFQQGNEFE